MTNAAPVSFGEIRSITWRALANANVTFTTLRTPNPRSSRTWVRSPVERLMISPDDIFR